MTLILMILLPLFLIAFVISVKFIYSEEGKDERGREITNASYMHASPIFPIGWLLVEIYHKQFEPLSVDMYRDTIAIILFVTVIVQGITIFTLKRRA
ncbi:hypothetical protein EVJ20_13290 [Exiguobacterium sp. SH0S1]|uniref:hypothetical protein n=1 Tax=unclassified Exiguobacterium TaxID=2644629 RepID=UPI00103AA4A2|nr:MULTISPECIES: hypothetical protein [unclassified Exiguobacterium]TCI51984.1 hypothetical protein EVJ24_12715 [Exiguobacterium sp. SH1S21]TCI69118.1 hypothetical protein EVJ22_11675 [Exiguobacterium sp. SH0S7]TCI75941.1 hypothetical protein EVJ20_13290 [Exiguobacterium sp. SH0S1]